MIGLILAFIVGLFMGSLFHEQIANLMYYIFVKAKSYSGGDVTFLVNYDKITLVENETHYVLTIDIDNPIKTTFVIPKNANKTFVINISKISTAEIYSAKDSFVINIEHKRPVPT